MLRQTPAGPAGGRLLLIGPHGDSGSGRGHIFARLRRDLGFGCEPVEPAGRMTGRKGTTVMTAKFHTLLGAALVVFLSVATPAAAQDVQSLQDQLQRLQRELSDLERYVYAGSGGVPTATGATGNVAATQEVRLQQLETQISQLTGKIEELSFRIDQVAQQVERMNADIDFRLRALEQGGIPAPTTMSNTDMTHTEMSSADVDPTASAPSTSTGTTAPTPTTPSSSGTLGTISQADLDAQLANQPAVDPTATGADAPAATSTTIGGGTTETAAVIAPYDLPGETAEAQYEYAFGLLRQAEYDDAELAFRTFLDRHPDDLLAGNAQYWLGETYYVRANYQQAAVTFAEGYQKYPNSGKAPDNLLKLAMALGELGKNQEACVALGQLRKEFPNAPANIQDRAVRERERFGC
jgi:tol-pal system protein YbgF